MLIGDDTNQMVYDSDWSGYALQNLTNLKFTGSVFNWTHIHTHSTCTYGFALGGF